jgi:2-polyprenyl-3-methyl-5-hydroxy-6-metoxy-1,4-benzoquinol methylase
MKFLPDNPVCNLCGDWRFSIIEDDEFPFRVLKCQQCSLVFVHPQPIVNDLKHHYDEPVYYSEWIGRQKAKRTEMWKYRLNRILSYKTNGKLLDIGCGEGAFLRIAQRHGWQISGTELSAYAAQYASDILGVDIFCGEIFNAGFPEKSFDVITLWHVLEHVSDPKMYLTEIRRIIKNDGILVIAVPNVNDIIMQTTYRIVKKKKMKLFSKMDKELHLYHFSGRTLNDYLNQTGFNRIRLSPDFGIIESSKKMINYWGAILYYLFGIKIFNALEIIAAPKHKAETP